MPEISIRPAQQLDTETRQNMYRSCNRNYLLKKIVLADQGWSLLKSTGQCGQCTCKIGNGLQGQLKGVFKEKHGLFQYPEPLCLKIMGTFLIYNWPGQHVVSFSEVFLAFAEAYHSSLHVKWLECTYNNVTAPQRHLDYSCLSHKTHMQMHKPHVIPFPTSAKALFLLMPQEPSLLPGWELLPVCMERDEFLGPWWTTGTMQGLPWSSTKG